MEAQVGDWVEVYITSNWYGNGRPPITFIGLCYSKLGWVGNYPYLVAGPKELAPINISSDLPFLNYQFSRIDVAEHEIVRIIK